MDMGGPRLSYKCRLKYTIIADKVAEIEGPHGPFFGAVESTYHYLHLDVDLPFIPPVGFRINEITFSTKSFNIISVGWYHALGRFVIYLGAQNINVVTLEDTKKEFALWQWRDEP